jgi:hypothetical protein
VAGFTPPFHLAYMAAKDALMKQERDSAKQTTNLENFFVFSMPAPLPPPRHPSPNVARPSEMGNSPASTSYRND